MRILYGTTNNGKLQAMKNAVKDLDIELISLNDVDSDMPNINENGTTPLENAEIKNRNHNNEKINLDLTQINDGYKILYDPYFVK